MSSQLPSQQDPFPLEQCIPSDLPAMARVYHSAFAPSPPQAILLPPTIPYSAIEEWFISTNTPKFTQPEVQYFKITDASTGELAGFIRWGYPHMPAVVKDEAKESGQQIVKGWPEGTNLAFADEMFTPLIEWRKKYVEWEETYVAYLLVVDPKYQKRGFASRLLKVVLDIADAEGRKSYIEASPDGYHVYYKLGFREIDRVSISLEKYGDSVNKETASVCMVREPFKQ